MSNGADAAILDADAARSATDTRRAAIRAAGTGFSIGRMLAVTRKELRSYFAFPLVYVLSGVFLVLAGYYAYTDLVFFVTIAFAHDIMQNYWSLLFTDIRLCLLLTLPFIIYGFLGFTRSALTGRPQRRVFIPSFYLWGWLVLIVVFWIFRNTPWYPFAS